MLTAEVKGIDGSEYETPSVTVTQVEFMAASDTKKIKSWTFAYRPEAVSTKRGFPSEETLRLVDIDLHSMKDGYQMSRQNLPDEVKDFLVAGGYCKRAVNNLYPHEKQETLLEE